MNAGRLTCALVVLVALAAVYPAAAQTSLRVVGGAELAGTIAGISAESSTLTIHTDAAPTARRDVFIHATTRFVTGPTTDASTPGDAAVRLLKPGDRVRVGGLMLSDGRMLALNLRLLSRSLRPSEPGVLVQAPAPRVIVDGVVADVLPDALILAEKAGPQRVPLTLSARPERAGSRLRAIQRNDIVRLEEFRTTGQQTPRTRLVVIFAAGAPVAGRVITAGSVGTRYLILRGSSLAGPAEIAVIVAPDARLVHDRTLSEMAQLKTGQLVTVYGYPISVGTLVSGGQSVAVDAKVISW